MGSGVERNAPCPCGSGKKYKKCCLLNVTPAPFTREERASAFAKLDRFVDQNYQKDDSAAYDDFWDEYLDREEELGEQWHPFSEAAFDVWFAFDRRLPNKKLVVDEFLERDDREHFLSAGERNYLESLRASSMRLYEVTDVVPGVSVTLRDLVEGDQITVHEKSGSRRMGRFDWFATRVCARGASGKPEMDGGLFQITRFVRNEALGRLKEMRADWRPTDAKSVEAFYKEMPPFFHQLWVGSILDPRIPELRNTDGEEILITDVRFEVLDPSGIAELLSSEKTLERGEKSNSWMWTERNKKGQAVTNGFVELHEKTLLLTTNSKKRGEKGRELIERLLGGHVRYRATTHQDMVRDLKERIRQGGAEPENNRRNEPRPGELPREINEALVLDHLAKHYRAWLDEPIPALEDKTPREAAKREPLREKLTGLIHDLEGMYQQALKRGDPAYDPSWMWSELGMAEPQAKSPPQLAYERIDEIVPGALDSCGKVADQVHRAPGFDEKSTVIQEDALAANLDLQRLLREYREGSREKSAFAPVDADLLNAHLLCMSNFELHRRKTFWVDESLAYMLGQTDVDVMGHELRAPFASFALVFTDRHTLSLAERHLSDEHNSPLAGHLLKVATVYVTEEATDSDHVFHLNFAVDALGADAPALISCEITLANDAPVEEAIDKSFPKILDVAPLAIASPLRGLIQITLNAILYATSAGVEPEIRRIIGGGRARTGHKPDSKHGADEVYYLPGAIDISHVRNLQELERTSSGRPMLNRFMVRGHWRRPAKTWKEQRMRWIQPYWKGPDIASVIERAYRLKP